jgi:hypothetical protein
MSDKSESYWEGFADGQRDIESQHGIERDSIKPNEFIHSLDLFAGWLLGQIENNGSGELGDDGAPMFKDYGTATQAMFAAAFAQARLLRSVAACIFKLNQGDFTEEHFHHEIDFSMSKLEEEADNLFFDHED